MKIFSTPSFSFSASNRSPQMLKRDVVPKCYLHDGRESHHFACDLSATVSTCCDVNHVCLDNKLCRTDSDIYRSTCTDPTWHSPDCPQFCLGFGGDWVPVISCQNATNSNPDFCCREIGSDIDCCQTGQNKIRLPSTGKPVAIIGSSASSATRHISRSSTESTSFFASSASTATRHISRSPSQPSFTSSFPQTSSSTSVVTLAIGAKVGIGVGVFFGIIVMVLPSILLWRSRPKNRISKRKGNGGEQFAKAEMDADEPQRPDYKVRELPGDMAHELRGETNDNEVWELPGDMAHELGCGRHGNGVEELSEDMAHELGDGRSINSSLNSDKRDPSPLSLPS